VKISPGKWKRLQAVSNARGVIAALAIDQRSALRSLLSKAIERDADSVPAEMLVQFKEAVSRILTPHASAILLDPEYGLPAAKLRAESSGLLLAYEKTGYDKNAPGRLPELLESWSVKRLVEAGADGIKVLVYYSPSSAGEINDKKHDWVQRVGAECEAADVPFFLELVSYQEGLDEKSAEFARIKPEATIGGVEEFSKARYCVDVLKVGMPMNLAYVEGSPSASREILYSREEAKARFRKSAAAAQLPFIYLSEGVSNEAFNFGLELAAEAGASFSGVLCGRAIWKDGVAIFAKHGLPALEDWLSHQGARNLQNVKERLAGARPWFECRREISAHVERK
jgi:tagatose 1,6-diphosphate aldolase